VFITVYVAITMILGIYSGIWFTKRTQKRQLDSVEDRIHRMMEEAQKEAQHLKRDAQLQAREDQHKLMVAFDEDLARRRRDADELHQAARDTERTLAAQLEQARILEVELHRDRQRLREAEASVQAELAALRDLHLRAQTRLEEIAGLDAAAARQGLLQSLEAELRHESAVLIRRIEDESREQANKKARKTITLAIQQCASEVVTEATISTMPLASEDMKGRIIGREGRNIRALESVTGVNIVVDDTPEAVVLSCFDPMRREIAREALERLLADGRIHPARIEEVVEKVRLEMDERVMEAGRNACFDCGIMDAAPEVMQTMGRLKFRTSFGQNILAHSVEVSHLTAALAAELGADVATARRAGFFHDIGKAVTGEVEGPHALVGAEMCRKAGESSAVVHAIAAHHNEEEPKTVVAVLLQAADAISAARPGARRESLEKYIKKLEHLETLAASFPGVSKAYAIQAGREVRVMVDPAKLDDDGCTLLAREVARKIEQELQFPGQIKVTVLRESRVVEFAK